MRDHVPSRTAEAVCFMRAVDHLRPPERRVVDDPLAHHFLGAILRGTLGTLRASGLAERDLPHSQALLAYVICRHRFLDDALLRAAAAGIDQLVLLGTGYDTRPWRFAAPLAGIPVFEVDHASTAGRRARVVARHPDEFPEVAGRRRVDIDFQTQALPARLEEAGFARGGRTFVMWEGVSMYLTRSAVKATLADLHALTGPGSTLAMDFWFMVDAPDLVSSMRRISPHLLQILGEPITFGVHPEDVGDFLRRAAWSVEDVAPPDELARRYLPAGVGLYPASYPVVAVRGPG